MFEGGDMNVKRIVPFVVFFLLGLSGVLDRGGLKFAREIPSSSPGSSSEAGIPGSYGRNVNRSKLWAHGGNLLWGFSDMYQLKVLYEPEDPAFQYKAWFFGWATPGKDCNPGYSGCDAIFAARSHQLESGWQVYAGPSQWDSTMDTHRWVPVVTARNLYYDQWHNGDPSVIKLGGRYLMAYSSTGFNKDGKPYGDPGDKDGSFQCVMGASSTDGINWERSKAPLQAGPDEYGTPTLPHTDMHLYGVYQRPSLLYEDGTFKLWFDYATPGGISMGYAENHGDFMNPQDWKPIRNGRHPCLENFPNPDVIRVDGLYYAYGDPSGYSPKSTKGLGAYEGAIDDDAASWMGRKIVEAVSLDGLNWVVLGYVDPDPDTPAIQVPQAFLRREGQTTWMYVFYACQRGGKPYDFRYDRIRYMRRKITGEEVQFYKKLCTQASSNTGN